MNGTLRWAHARWTAATRSIRASMCRCERTWPLLAGLALAAPLRAQVPSRRFVLDTARSRIRFEGASTFGAFTAIPHEIAGWATLPDPADLTAGRGTVVVRVASFTTGIALRDRHLRDALDAREFPEITFAVGRVLPATAPADSAWPGRPLRIEGTLTIRDQPHEVGFDAAARTAGDTLVVLARAELRFTQLGMKPPSRLLGVARVRDPFQVDVLARFVPVNP